jgi:putative inorganic carbon (HCO3(-)) transporter
MASISGERTPVPSLVIWAMVILGVAITLGVLAGGMANPFMLIAGITGLVMVMLLFRNPEWALLVLVFTTYTMLTDVLVNTHGLPSLTKPLIALLYMLLLARWFLRGEPPAGGGKALLVSSGYIIFASLSFLYAVYIDSTAENIAELVKNVAILILITLYLKHGDTLRRVTYSILVGGLFLGTISTIQYLTGTFSNGYWGFGLARIQDIVGEMSSYRIGGPIGDPNFYGQLLLFPVSLAVDRMRYDEDRFWRLIAACTLAVTLLSIAFTFSRGTFLGAGIVLILMLVKDPPRPVITGTILALAAIALLVLMPQYLGRMYTLIETAFHISNESSNFQDDAIEGRLGEMRVALGIFLDHPLLGVGIGNYEHYFQHYSLLLDLPQRGTDRAAHSLYLEICAERGLLGLSVYLAMIWYIFSRVLKSAKRLRAAGLTSYEHMVLSYGYSLLGYLITGVFLHELLRFVWVIMGICLSTPAIASYEIRRASTLIRKEGGINEQSLSGQFPVGSVAGNSP